MTNIPGATVTADAAERAAIARWENEGGHTIPLDRRASLSFRAEVNAVDTTAKPLRSPDRTVEERPGESSQ
jgi:hypothetical protein